MADVVLCPSAAEIEAYLKGGSSLDVLEAVAKHIEGCDACCRTVDRLAEADETMADLARGGKTVSPPDAKDASVEALIEKLQQMPAPKGEETQVSVERSSNPSAAEATAAEAFVAGDPIAEIRELLEPPLASDELGRLGSYRILKVLGSGGMGVVFLAEDTNLRRFVALKAMRPDVAKRPTSRQRFLREAQAAAAIKHDNIVAIHAIGEERGIPFLAIEFLEGESLDDRIRRLGRFQAAEIVRIGREAALGLAAAHKRGLVHRDIKPANLWLEGDAGKVKVLDFGLARGEDEETQLTQSGMIVGTPAYMAPEQARGVKVDARCDLFSLGVVLYRLCSGNLPFQADTTMGILTALALDAPKPIGEIDPTLPKELGDLITQLLAKKPEDRPASAQDVADRLARIERHLVPQQRQQAEPDLPATLQRSSNGTSRGRAGWVVAIGLLLAFGGGALGVYQLVFRTPNGTLVVEVSDDAEVLFSKGKLQILDEKGQPKYLIEPSERNKTLPAGKYLITINGPDGLKLDADRFEIGAGAKKVRVMLDDNVAAAKIEPKVDPKIDRNPNVETQPVPGPSDKEKPFVVVRKSGEKVEAVTFARALQLHQDGDAIEVHGNGPFKVNEYRIENKTFVLRAGDGYRPQFRTDLEKHFLTADQSKVEVTGCDFRFPLSAGSLFGGTKGDFTLKDCRLLVGLAVVARLNGGAVRFHDCLIAVGYGFGGGPWVNGNLDHLELKNCMCRLPQPMIGFEPTGDSATVVLEKNTIIANGNFFYDLTSMKKKFEVLATGNIFQRNESNGNLLYPAFTNWKDKVEWTGSNNLYVHSVPGSEVFFDKEGKKRASGLAAWTQLWGKAEPGSKEAATFTPMWRSVELAHTNEALIAAVKPAVDSYKAKLPDLGPDWSLMGPGEGYLRALAAQGKPVPKDRLRPPPIEGAPFVLVRGDKVVKAFDHFTEATKSAMDGDTIEIRTEDPLPTPQLQVTPSVKSLTIKASPGYRPVVEGVARWIATGMTLTVEGIHFEGGSLNLSGHEQTGNVPRLARVVNCSFSPEYSTNWRQTAIGDGSSFVQPPLAGAMEIVNCFVSGGANLYLQTGGELKIHNSLVGSFNCISGRGKGAHTIRLRKSVVWMPVTYMGGVFVGSHPADGTKGPDWAGISIDMEDCLVDGARELAFVDPGSPLVAWKGDRNAYRLGEGVWYSVTGQSHAIANLAQWREKWNSDANSIQADPLVYDRQAWKLAPGSPNHGFGADWKSGSTPSAGPKSETPPLTVEKPDKEKPFVLVRKSGEKAEAATFARALELHQDGDAIEVHGNGPFRVNEYRVANKAFVLRAGNGYRPQFRTDNEKWFLSAENVKLDVSGCDFRYPWGDGYLFGGSGDWSFRDCRMLVGKGSIGGVSGNSKVRFHDCLISREWQGNPWFGGTIDHFEMKGCFCRVNQPLFAIAPAGDSATVLLEKNTFVVLGAFFSDMSHFGKKKLKVQASGNIFERSDVGLLNYPTSYVVKDSIDWFGSDNFYAQSSLASEVHFDKEGKKKASGLEAWTQLWGKPESGAKEAPRFTPLWRSIDLANTNESLIDAVKPSVDAFKTKLPKLGPDWSVMGPGDAYLRALAAQGKPIPKERLRPQTQEGAVFVVIRGDQIVKAFDQLPEASANTMDGDTIEIRTDETITAPHLRTPESVKSLAIKAAPGYRPVIEGPAMWISDGLTLAVEGLHFEGGPLDRAHGNVGDGRLARIANCSFSLKSADALRRSVGGHVGFIQPSAKGPMEIVNCLVAGRVFLQSESGAALTIDNTVIGKLHCLISSGKAVQQVRFRNSILWQPANAWDSQGSLIHSEPREGAKGPDWAKISVRSEDSLFDCGSGFISAAVPQVSLAGWKGERNVYRFNEGPWQLVRNDPKSTEVVKLAQWRDLWKSDADSVQADPLFYERAAWKAMPGTPGEGFGVPLQRPSVDPNRR